MRKTKLLTVLGILYIGFGAFISCNANINSELGIELSEDKFIPSVNEEKKLSDFKTNFGKSVFLTVQAARDVYNTLELNGYVDEQDSSNEFKTKGKSARKLVSLDEIGKNYVNKIKTKNNSDSIVSKSSNSSDENESVIKDRLNEISENYRSDIISLVPKYEDGSIGYYMTISDGKIYVGGDVVANVGSPESIALIETYNRVKNGENLYDVIEDIQNDVNQLLKEYDGIVSKALYVNPDLGSGVALSFSGVYGTYERWTGGDVYYQWDGMSEGQKEVVKKAMGIWQNGTNGEVSFSEIKPNAWDWTMYALGQKNWVLMKSDKDVWGQALIGAGWGSYLKLNPSIEDCDSDYYVGVACHELGHVIGLAHEFQRPDRDNYCYINSLSEGSSGVSKIANYDKLPSSAVVAGFKKVKIWFVTLYIPYIWYYDYAKTYGSFDYDSIMQYDCLKLKMTNEALSIIKRDKKSNNPRISVSFNRKSGDYVSNSVLMDRLCSFKKVSEIGKDSILKNYDIELFLYNRNTRPSINDFNAIKKLY